MFFRICYMYTFIETYLQLRVEMIFAVLWLHVKPPWVLTLSTRWVIFPDATALILEKGNVRQQSHKQNVLFDLQHFLQAALQVALGSCSDSTQTLNQCSYMTYDNLSKSDSAESLLHLWWPAKGCSRHCAEQHSQALGMWRHFNDDVSAYLNCLGYWRTPYLDINSVTKLHVKN